MAVSGVLRLTDLNDFITPSQACIKPVEIPSSQPPDPASATTQIHIDASGAYYESSQAGPSSTRKLETAQINLNDCLACSGCITSAESVLITMQSHQEVFQLLSSNPSRNAPAHRIPVLSISPQSLASIAASISSRTSRRVSMRQVLRRIQRFATKSLGFEHVFDTTFARHISLLEHAYEFNQRKTSSNLDPEQQQLPMLASACPGWICYAEKTHPEMIPFISRTRSPQQIMGTLVKEWLAKRWEKSPQEIYHVTVMPCYDKKLEASRQDFYNDVYATRDVDCVLTTGELELMALEKDYDLTVPVPQDVSDGAPFPELLTTPGSSSGSYLQTLVDTFSGPNTKVDINTNRTDYEEVLVKEVSSGRTLFRGAKCYGFRNLQNLVRKIGKDAGLQTTKGAAGRLVGRTTRKAPRKVEEKGYDYVEVMACPSGCVNGGGQLGRPATELQENDGIPTTRWGDKAWVEQVEASYWGDDAPDVRQWEAANALAAQILAEVCLPTDMRDEQGWNEVMDEAAEERRRAYFRTSYRKVEGDVIGLAVKW